MKPQVRSMLGLALVITLALGAQSWWAGHHRASLGAEVAALAQPGDIHMLSSDSCGICDQARHWFTTHQVPFTECSIERDAACRASFARSLSPGTPVLQVRGRALLGFSPERLRAVLAMPA